MYNSQPVQYIKDETYRILVEHRTTLGYTLKIIRLVCTNLGVGWFLKSLSF